MTYYHLSVKDYGQKKLFYPRAIYDGTYSTPCICVCPSVAQCLYALPIESLTDKGLHIYATSHKGATNRWTKQIFDFKITEEKRFYKRVWYEKVDFLDGFDVSYAKEVRIGVETLLGLDLLEESKADHMTLTGIQRVLDPKFGLAS